MDGPILSRPDWAMIGVPQIGGGVAVFVSGRVETMDLSVTYPEPRNWHGWPPWRVPPPEPPPRCEMTAVLHRFAVVMGPDYGAALGAITRQD